MDEGKGKYNGVKLVSEGKKERDYLNVVVRNVYYRYDDNDFMLNRSLFLFFVFYYVVFYYIRYYYSFRI